MSKKNIFKKIKGWLYDKKVNKLHKETKKISKEIVDEQIYDMSSYVAEFILPMLKYNRNHNPVKHEYMTEYEFTEAVDNMIYAFEFHSGKDNFKSLPDFDRIKKGLMQFAENFCYFSW
jgi:hypothetical protein